MRCIVFVDDDEDLLEAMREILQCAKLADCVAARSLATADDLICVAGSFFLAAELRHVITEPGLRT